MESQTGNPVVGNDDPTVCNRLPIRFPVSDYLYPTKEIDISTIHLFYLTTVYFSKMIMVELLFL